MKQKKLLALLMAVLMVLALLPAVAAAEDEVYYTLDGTNKGTNSNYGSEGTVTQGSITWKVTGNVNIEPWRIGGKSITGVDRPVYSTQPMNETITKVELELGTINLTVNSLKFVVASDDSFGTIIEEQTITDVEQNNTYIFTPDEGKEWTNAYYKFVFNVTNSQSSNKYVQFVSAKFYKTASGTPTPTYTVSFDANGGTGTMANVTTTSPYTLPNCGFTAPDGKEFDYWAVDGDEGMYAPGASYALTGDTTFVAQWKDLPVVTYTDMMLKRVPANGDVVVIYYPTAGKVMTGTDYVYNSKHELTTVDATLTDDVLAVPSDALRLTVITTVADDGETTLYTFATADGRYLYADASHVQLVDEQGANTLFQLETAAAGTDNYYIKCDSANYNGKAQYLRYINGYISVYSIYANTGINTFQFFSEDGEGPTPEVTYIVTLDPGEAGGEQVTIEDATSPYTLPDCPFTAPEGYVFDGWQADNGDVYAAGTEVVLEEQNTAFTATWKELVARTYELVTSEDGLVDGGTYLIASELFADELYLMSKQTTNNRAQYKVTGVEGTTLTLDESWIATNAADDLVFEFTLEDAEDGWAFHDKVSDGFLYAAGNETNKKNWLRTETELDDNGIFIIAYEGNDGATVPVAQGENTYGYMHYNATSDIFSCYAKTSSITGAVYLYKLVEDAPAAAPSFKTQSLTLSGQIGVNFYMDLPTIEGVNWENSYMTFTIRHGSVTERDDYDPDDKNPAGTYYAFTAYVNSIQMAEPITATFHWTEGEEEKTIEKTYAIKDYFIAYDANKSKFDEKTQKLIEATADYGHYTQAFLAAANGWVLGTDYVEMDKFYATAYNYSDTEAGLEGYTIECNKGDEIRKIGAATVLDSETAIRITLTPISGYTGTINATADGGKDATVTPSGSRYIVEIPNIAAHELTNTYTVTITTANSTATVTLSALSYVKLLFNGNTEAPARNAASAILSYAMAAYAYNNH